MKSEQTWAGVLLEADDLTYRLADAGVVNPDQSITKADGQVFLPRNDVAYMQHAP